MGKGSSQTVGYRYQVAYQMGLCYGPLDAFLAFKAGTKVAWTGNQAASGTININQPNLFGGDADQGGIVGDMDICMGEATQQVNPYMLATFSSLNLNVTNNVNVLQLIALIAAGNHDAIGNLIHPSNADAQLGANRGFATVVYKGGVYGSMNPYPQKASYQVCKVVKGWEGDVANDGSACWYSAKAPIAIARLLDSRSIPQWRYLVVDRTDSVDYSSPDFDDASWQQGQAPFASFHDMSSSYWTNVTSMGFYASPGTNVPQAMAVWMRGTIYIPAPNRPITFRAWVDNGIQFYVNGTKVIDDYGTYGHYLTQTLPANTFKNGNNFIAVRGTDDTITGSSGWFYFDFAVDESVPVIAMNPAHILYYAITQPHMGREPAAAINAASFQAAADWFYARGFGLCTTYDASQESIEQFRARIEKVAGCSCTRSPVDGCWYLDVANGVYTLADLPVIGDDDILEYTDQPATFDSAINSVSVTYNDPQLDADVTPPPVQALGLVNTFGVIHQSTDYKEIPNGALALRVAQRDLMATTTPTHGFELTVMPRAAYALRRGQYFRLQVPKRGIADMVCIVGDIKRGTLKSGAIVLAAVEDIYSLPSATFVQPSTGINPGVSTPVAVSVQSVFEAPYIELARMLPANGLADLSADDAYVMACAANPGGMSSYALLDALHGVTPLVDVDASDFCAYALVVEGDALSGSVPATSFTLADAIDTDRVAVGSAALWGSEIVRVDAIDALAGTLTLGRGCADTVAVAHATNSPIFFYQDSYAADPTTLAVGASIDVKLLPKTGSAQLDPSLASVSTIALQGRASLPYPPGLLRIAGNPYPATVSGAFTVTWAHRNRVAQADQLVDASMASVTPADNTRYHLKFVDSTGALLVERNDIGPGTASVTLNYTGNVTMTLFTIDDIGESLQHHAVTFAYTPPAGSPTNTITATAYTPVVPEWNIDGNLGS